MTRRFPPPSGARRTLRFGAAARTASAALVAGTLTALTVAAVDPGAGGAPLLAFLAFAVAATGAAAIEVFGVAHRLTSDGIERVTPWRRRVAIRWSDVASVEWTGRAGWFELRSRTGDTVRVYRQLAGIATFAAAALEGLPAGVIDGRPGLRERLEQLARGEEPPDVSDREEWRGS